MNQHDNLLFPESFEKLMETADLLNLDIDQAFLTLDSGFDDQKNVTLIEYQSLHPVIKPNPRNCSREKRYQLLDRFKPLEKIYHQRVNIERCFAWKAKYRKLVTRYEILQCTHQGFRLLAYSLVNFREIFNNLV